MNSLVIVAIPAEDDPVWKVSSEKVPHLTLLYLGEATEEKNADRIAEFVEHALNVQEHGPFYLEIDYRGELGDDKADVLFFEGGWDTKWIKQIRGQLLQQTDIHAAHISEDQFPEWQPHLTLGYPDSPAKKLPEDYHRLYSVHFDRIAVWDGDYEGPEFRLKWPNRDAEELYPAVAYSAMSPEAINDLLHFGVKGMRWGQRKDTTVTVNGKTKQVSAKKAARLDKQWKAKIYSVPGAVDVHNRMAEHFNERIGALNDKHNYDFSKTQWDKPTSWNDKEMSYMKDVDALTLAGNRIAVKEVHGTSPTGKLRAELAGDGDRIVVHESKIKHAADDTTAIAVLKITRNANGLITKIEPLELEDEMAQASELGEEFIEHFGVKGMKWGVRKEGLKSGVKKTAKAVDRAYGKLEDAAADRKFQKRANTSGNVSKLINQAAAKTKTNDLPKINAKYEGKAKTSKSVRLLHLSKVPVQKQYREEVKAAYLKNLNDVANSTTSGSGRLKYEIAPANRLSSKPTATRWRVKAVKVEHAALSSDEFDVIPVFDDDGFIIDFKTEAVSETELAQSVELGEEFIKHYGVKGMRWGVRKESLASGAKAVGRGIGKVATVAADIQFENLAKDGRAAEAIELQAHSAFRRTDLPKINAKPEYVAARKRRTRLRHPKDPLVKQYRKEVKTTYIKRLEEAANSRTNATGTRQYTVRERGWELPKEGGNLPTSKHMWTVSTREVKHATEDDATAKPFYVALTLDADGFVTDIETIDSSVEHSLTLVDLGEEFLQHFGVKGMRWGVRNRKGDPVAVTPTATSKVPHGRKRKTKIETEGGENHAATEDAIKVAEAKAKLKKSGPAALTNQELRDVANRVQLENQVALLTSNKGKRFVKRQLENEGQSLAKKGVREGVKRGVKKGARIAGTAAVVAA